MAINKNHLFEEFDGTKCAVVEKDVSEDRMQFLKGLLEFNGYTVVITKAAAVKAASKSDTDGDESTSSALTQPEKYNIGVTDVTFNSTNAIFGRILKTGEGRVVTMAYWNQLENRSNDQIPYYENKNK